QLRAVGDLVQVLGATAVGGPHPNTHIAQEGHRVRRCHTHHHGQVEQAAGGSTDTLAVVGIDRSIGEDDHVGPGRVGGTQHRARVTRVPHVGKNGCQPYVPDLFEGNVHEPTDGDDTLWGDGLGQFRHHVQADPVGG